MIKSRQELIRSSKVLLAAAMLVALPLQAELTSKQKAVFEQAQEKAEGIDLNAFLGAVKAQEKKGRAMIDQTVERSSEIAVNETSPAGKAQAEERAASICKNRTKYLFVSRSLGKSAMKEIMAEASANQDLTLVFQGVPKGQTINKGVLDIQAMAREFTPMPSVALNPILFQEFEVEQVPELMILTEGEWVDQECVQDVRVRVAGITSLDYLDGKEDEGDLGKRGPTEAVSEPNLMDVIAKRIGEVDWEAKKKRAVDNVWNNIPMYPLPPAPENRIVRIDPTIEAKKTIRDAEGNVVVAKGTRINPLELRSFDSIVLVFNPMRESELQAAKEIVGNAVKNGEKIIPVLSQINKAEGWTMYNEVARELDHRVFMLTPELKSRFRIMHTMSVIRASGRYFEVREVQTDM